MNWWALGPWLLFIANLSESILGLYKRDAGPFEHFIVILAFVLLFISFGKVGLW